MCRIMPIEKRVLDALKGGPTRRSLFGPVDHNQLKRDHRRLLQADLEDASRRWGFDFLTDTPLEGSDFQWEIVPSVKVPALYHPSTVNVGDPQRSEAAPEPVVDNAQRSKEPVLWIPENNAMKRKQTNITDFYQAKRRAVSTPRKSGQ